MMAEVDAQANNELQALVENKWGFLKNIININTFFANADDASGSKSSSDDKQPSETFNERRSKFKNVDAVEGAFDKSESQSENQMMKGDDQEETEEVEKDMDENREER
jgi:hypothetical protein